MKTFSSLPVKLDSSNLRPIAYRILSRKYGLNIKRDALDVLTDIIGLNFGSNWKGIESQNYLEKIAKIWKSENKSIFIDGDGLKDILKKIDHKSSSNTDYNIKKKKEDITILGEKNVSEDESSTIIDWKQHFNFILGNEMITYVYDKKKKHVIVNKVEKTFENKLEHNLKNCTEFFYENYYLLLHRILRNKDFYKTNFFEESALDLETDDSKTKITQIKNLIGKDNIKFVLFGLLSVNSNNSYILEDSTDYIELNFLKTCKVPGSFYCVGMYVLVEGIYSSTGGMSCYSSNNIGGLFYTLSIFHPLAEKRDFALEKLGYNDISNFYNEINKNQNRIDSNELYRSNSIIYNKLLKIEKSLSNNKIVFIGADCFLDVLKIKEGLMKIFTLIEDSLNLNDLTNESSNTIAVVLIGSFYSKPIFSSSLTTSTSSVTQDYRQCFDQLSNMLENFPKLLNVCKIVLIPGENDLWQSYYSCGNSNISYFPYKQIPLIFLTKLKKLIPSKNLILGWNPTRINYLTQEIVVFKDKLMKKFKSNDINFPNDPDESNFNIENKYINNDPDKNFLVKTQQARMLVKTLLDQGYLVPIKNNLRSIDSFYSNFLKIDPLPTAIVLNDTLFGNFNISYCGCRCVNISSFFNPINEKINYTEYNPTLKKFDLIELQM